MNDSPLFTPELEGLLREAAADPRSVLLRVPRPTSVRTLLAGEESAPPSSVGRTSLDRHLLATYRDELVELLMGACLVRLFSDDSVSLNVHRSRRLGEDWQAQSPREWAHEAQARLNDSTDQLAHLAGYDLLLEACRVDRLGELSITQLARTALQLRNAAVSQAWIALDQRLHGRFELSERLAGSILASHIAPSLAASVLETRATCRASVGDFGGAILDAKKAFREDDSKVSALVNWMHYAIMAGDEGPARDAGRLLDSVVRVPTQALLQQLHTFGELRRVGLTKYEDSMRRVAQALADGVGPLARKVIDVYL